MFDGIEYRGFSQENVEILAQFAGVPVWNGLTDQWHPTQMLADMLTIRDHAHYVLQASGWYYYRPEDKAKSYDRMRGVGKTYLVQAESTAAPSTPTNWPDPKYYVAYYTKSIDHGRVISAMETASIPLHMTAPVLPDNTVSNGIACTDSTPLDALKTTAHALIDGGVPIYVVSRATPATSMLSQTSFIFATTF